uniref:hypothetical protein n=1 Tax=Klebsiella sp. TaxID=576 RepID=UPI0031D23127
MRERTIWAAEWQREHGNRLPRVKKMAAFIPVLLALWNIFRAIVVVVVVLIVAGVIFYMIFKEFV